MYDQVIRMNAAREKMYIMRGDTVNYYMTTIKRSLGWAYRDKGDYRTAARYFEQLAVLRDSIKNREQKSAALELAAVYETNEKDLFIQQQAADMQKRNLLLAFILCIVFLLGVLLWRTIRHNRIIRRKNKAMVDTIEDLLIHKEELYRKKEENLILKEQLEREQNLRMGDRYQPIRTGKRKQLLFRHLKPEMEMTYTIGYCSTSWNMRSLAVSSIFSRTFRGRN